MAKREFLTSNVRFYFRLFAAGCLLHFPCVSFGQSTKPSTVAASSSGSTACGDKVKAARTAGYKEGFGVADASCQSSAKDAQSVSFLAGFDSGQSLYTKDLGNIDEKIPIHILVEDIPGAEAYQLAAAELISTYFSRRYTLTSDSALSLYITGSKSGDDKVFSYRVSMQVSLSVPVRTGKKWLLATGHLVLSDRDGYLVNYSQLEKTQAIKEALFTILTEGDSSLASTEK